MKFLKVKGKKVVNVALFDEAPSGWKECPDGVGVGWLVNDDGTYSAPAESEPTPRMERDMALSGIVHDFGDGRIIQCRPHPFSDEANIKSAIDRMTRISATDCDWLGMDDIAVKLSLSELKTVLESGQDQAAAIWADFLKAV